MASALAGDGSHTVGPNQASSSVLRSSSRPIGSRNPFLDPAVMEQSAPQHAILAAATGSAFLATSFSPVFQNNGASSPHLSASSTSATAHHGNEDTIMAERGQEPRLHPRLEDLSQAFSSASISKRNSSMHLKSSSPLRSPSITTQEIEVGRSEDSSATVAAPGTAPPLPQRRQSRSESSNYLPMDHDAWDDNFSVSHAISDARESRRTVAMPALHPQTQSISPSTSHTSLSPVPTVPGSDYPEPTTTPTPGRPLLRDGKLMLMPPSWESCSKCQGTGYKHSDPSQPHDSCWRSYGRHYTPALVHSSDVIDRAMLLQKPLPMCVRPSSFTPPALPVSTSGTLAQRVSSSPYSPPPPRRVSSGATYIAAPTFTPNRNSSAMTQPQQRRRSPPRVNRAADANEGGEDPQGEAPPAYEDVVKVAQNVQLPPQRNGEGGSSSIAGTGGVNEGRNGPVHGRGSSPAGRQRLQQQHSPPNEPPPLPSRRGETFSYPHGLHQHHSYGGASNGGGHSGSNGWPAYPQSHARAHPPPMFSGNFGGSHISHPSAAASSSSSSPSSHYYPSPPMPTAATPIVYFPGDARLGGILCQKCGGSGIRESLFFGDETCSRCSGIGRVR